MPNWFFAGAESVMITDAERKGPTEDVEAEERGGGGDDDEVVNVGKVGKEAGEEPTLTEDSEESRNGEEDVEDAGRAALLEGVRV